MVETVKEAAVPPGQRDRAATRRSQRRSLIIAAAEEELSASGLAGITLAAVGERVGLSKGALYYYVDGRDALLAMVLEDALLRIRRDADAAASASPLDRLRAFARAHVRCSVERPAGPLIAGSVHELASHEPTAALLREHTEIALDLVAEAVDVGQLRAVPPVVTGAALFGTLNSLAGSFDPTGPMHIDELVDAALDVLLAGLRPDGGARKDD